MFGSSFHGNLLLPDFPGNLTGPFGRNVHGFRWFICGKETDSVQASLLAQLAEACKHQNRQDDSSILQLQSRSTTFTCPHGEEDYTFADWVPKLYAVGDKPASGVTITNFLEGSPSCQLIAILSDSNSGGSSGAAQILECDCNALIQAADDSSDASVNPCRARDNRLQGYPTIELTFDEPQDILSATFQNVVAPWSTVLSYTNSADETVEIPVPDQGRSNPSVVDLTEEIVRPQGVKIIKVTLQSLSAFVGMKLCKRGGSLVGDPHVRTQDHGHYTVLNEGNFLAWRFNSDTDVISSSGLKKTEVDWQIYAHYSAHRRSWTRGLLLVDKSMRSERQSLELTSEECKLRKHIDGKWTTMDGSELVHVPEKGRLVTGFNFTHLDEKAKKTWAPKGRKARWDAKLLMTTKRGLQPIATVQLRCFPGRHIDVQVIRERMGDARFVGGQLGPHGIQLKREKNPGA